MLIPFIISICLGEPEILIFGITLLAAASIGGLLAWSFRNLPFRLNRREGYLLTTLTWILFSAFGMIPFLFCGQHLSIADAFFETMSGFTTTGATVIQYVESLSKSVLFWRAMIQWIGGLGIILFILALLPSLDQSGGISMFNAEITGITHDKLHPRIRKTAESLWLVYGIITIALILILWMGPMNLFDAICQAFTTVATGGFSTRNASIAGFNSQYVAIVITIFMFIAGVNFSLLYNVIHGKPKSLFNNDVFKAYCVIILASYIIILSDMLIRGEGSSIDDFFINPFFMILSALTSTGFSYHGYTVWGPLGITIIMILMFIGACAGSTTGAVKVDRVLAISRHLTNEVSLSLSPNHLTRVIVNNKILSTKLIARMVAFMAIYVTLIIIATLIISLYGIKFDDAIFAVISSIGNNGLGYGISETTYQPFPESVKWILSFLMLTGRLELFTVLVLFSPGFYK